MTSGTVEPNQDVTTEWNTTGANHFGEIADGVLQPTTPDTTTNISTANFSTTTDEFAMESIADVQELLSVVVWAYGSTQSTTINADAYIDGAWKGAIILFNTAQSGWKSYEWQGSWTQTDLDDLKIRLIHNRVTAGTSTVSAMYVQVTYIETPSGWVHKINTIGGAAENLNKVNATLRTAISKINTQ